MNGLNGTGLGVAALMKTVPAAPSQPAAPKASSVSAPFKDATNVSARPQSPQQPVPAKRTSKPESRAETAKNENTEAVKDVSANNTSQKTNPKGDTEAHDGAKLEANKKDIQDKDAKTESNPANVVANSTEAGEDAIEDLLSLIQQSQGELSKTLEPSPIPVAAEPTELTPKEQEILLSDSAPNATSQADATPMPLIDDKSLVDSVAPERESVPLAVVQSLQQATSTSDTPATEANEIVTHSSDAEISAAPVIQSKSNSNSSANSVGEDPRASFPDGDTRPEVNATTQHDDKLAAGDDQRDDIRDTAVDATKTPFSPESPGETHDKRRLNDPILKTTPDVAMPASPVNTPSSPVATPMMDAQWETPTVDPSVNGVTPSAAPQATSRPASNAPAAQAAALNVNVPVAHPSWGDAMSERVQMMVGNQLQSANIQLNPPHLGPVNVQIEMKGDEVNVVFSTHHGAVREALESSLPKLRDILNDSGSRTVNIDVSLQDFQQRPASQFLGQGAERQTRDREYFQQQTNYDVQTVSPPPAGYRSLGMLDLYA